MLLCKKSIGVGPVEQMRMFTVAVLFCGNEESLVEIYLSCGCSLCMRMQEEGYMQLRLRMQELLLQQRAIKR
jgi:hypothetical protein